MKPDLLNFFKHNMQRKISTGFVICVFGKGKNTLESIAQTPWEYVYRLYLCWQSNFKIEVFL